MKNAVFMSHGPKDESSGMGFVIPCPIFQLYFSYMMIINFIIGENWSMWRKPPTCLTFIDTGVCGENHQHVGHL